MNKKFYILILVFLLLIGSAITLQNFQGSSQWVWQISNSGNWLLPLISVAAIVDSINPCSFSVLLVSLIFLFGLGKSRKHILGYGLLYISGIFTAYLLIGLGLLQALHIFSVPHFMSKLAAGILLLFGVIEIINVIFPKFPIKLQIPHSAHQKMNELLNKATLPGMFLLGAFVGLCEFPCTGGPYLMVLGLLHDAKTYWQGAIYLVYYNILFILPLILILFIASNERVTQKIKSVQKAENKYLRLGIGFAMIILAYIIINL